MTFWTIAWAVTFGAWVLTASRLFVAQRKWREALDGWERAQDMLDVELRRGH